MSEPAHPSSNPPTSASRKTEAPAETVPWGYRPGIITAITVFLAFSLAFLRYWGFEAPGRWRWYSVGAEALRNSGSFSRPSAAMTSFAMRSELSTST